jgi:protein-S-isoprenylcysteine O-methyltransferase Ste14
MSATSSLYYHMQRHRVLLGRIVLGMLLVYVFGIERVTIMPFSSTLGIAGLAFIGAGLLVRSLSAGMLHKNKQLTTEGIYALVRNPLYFGSLLLLIGVNLIIADPLTAVVSTALFAATYVPTIAKEERGLSKAFPEQWVQYAASTPRLLPRLTRLGAVAEASWSYEQWRKNHEHNTILAAIAILGLLFAYGQYLGGQ